jgi:hypothetical protein
LLNDVLTDFDSYFFKILKLEMHNFIVLFWIMNNSKLWLLLSNKIFSILNSKNNGFHSQQCQILDPLCSWPLLHL